ncbi:L-threonine 3-dehydrogenase [Streptomyces sp. NPDC101150]|uniref:L-threonine 3-dehydrogenase n=1 Tax=Streptomyces sp. NPDC101150 TaxID=3366114 RepID=UPI0038271E90
MKALLKSGDRPGFRLCELPLPVPAEDEVLVRVLRTGICGTDLHIEAWDDWARSAVCAPRVPGHEFAGVVEAGPPSGPAPGTLVSGEGHVVCGQCRTCRAGRRHQCPQTERIGVERDGAFAEYMTLPAENIWTLPPTTALETAVLFDPLGNAVHAVTSFPVTGEDVLITGAGPIGLMSAAVARHLGARRVVVTETEPYRRKLAQSVGAHCVIDPSDRPLTESLAALVPGIDDGFALAVEASGHPGGIHDALGHLAPGGRIAVLGIPARAVEIDWSAIVLRMTGIQGIHGRRIFDTWRMASALLDSGLDPTPVITHHFGYEHYEAAFATAREGTSGKVVLDWSIPCTSES